MTDLAQHLIRLGAEECGTVRAVRFDPDARSFEAFSFAEYRFGPSTHLLAPLEATTLKEALVETTGRWVWDRGQRLGVREIGGGTDRLHIYAVRRKSAPDYVYRDYQQHREHAHWLDHICTIDLNVVAGINLTAAGCEIDIHEHRQARRPAGARMERVNQSTREPERANNAPGRDR